MQIASYGGQLAYTVHSESSYGANAIEPGPDVIIHVCFLLTATSDLPNTL